MATDSTQGTLPDNVFGTDPSVDEILPVVYRGLRELAHRQLRREHGVLTLQTTALVHEAYLRLSDAPRVAAKGRAYFFAAASRAMRQILVDYARRRNAQKRGGGVRPTALDGKQIAADALAADILGLDEALERLGAFAPRQAQVVECRFFGGLNVEETASALDVSPRTVKHDWALARAWLYDILHET